MDDCRLQEIINELDSAIPRDGAFAKFRTTDQAELHLSANNEGFLRLGVEFLKASFAPRDSAEGRMEVELKNVMGTDSENFIQIGERRVIRASNSADPESEKLFPERLKVTGFFVGCVLALLAVAVPWAYGIFRFLNLI